MLVPVSTLGGLVGAAAPRSVVGRGGARGWAGTTPPPPPPILDPGPIRIDGHAAAAVVCGLAGGRRSIRRGPTRPGNVPAMPTSGSTGSLALGAQAGDLGKAQAAPCFQCTRWVQQRADAPAVPLPVPQRRQALMGQQASFKCTMTSPPGKLPRDAFRAIGQSPSSYLRRGDARASELIGRTSVGCVLLKAVGRSSSTTKETTRPIVAPEYT